MMRNNLLTAAFIILVSISCSKEPNNKTNKISENNTVTVSFTNSDFTTKGFFDDSTVSDPWEKLITSLTIYIVDNSGKFVIQRNFAPEELPTLKADFAIPAAMVGSTYTFYAIANSPAIVMNKGELDALTDGNIADYNGTFADITTKNLRTNGFIMSGSSTASIAAVNTPVTIALNRTVSKVAIQATTTTAFDQRYVGAVYINDVNITSSAASAKIINDGSFGNYSAELHQVPNVQGKNINSLFYLYPNGDRAVGSRTTLTLVGIYDADKNPATTADQLPLEYKIELKGVSTGALIRNGYYRVAININGVTGSDISANITLNDWLAPITQTVEIGK